MKGNARIRNEYLRISASYGIYDCYQVKSFSNSLSSGSCSCSEAGSKSDYVQLRSVTVLGVSSIQVHTKAVLPMMMLFFVPNSTSVLIVPGLDLEISLSLDLMVPTPHRCHHHHHQRTSLPSFAISLHVLAPWAGATLVLCPSFLCQHQHVSHL